MYSGPRYECQRRGTPVPRQHQRQRRALVAAAADKPDWLRCAAWIPFSVSRLLTPCHFLIAHGLPLHQAAKRPGRPASAPCCAHAHARLLCTAAGTWRRQRTSTRTRRGSWPEQTAIQTWCSGACGTVRPRAARQRRPSATQCPLAAHCSAPLRPRGPPICSQRTSRLALLQNRTLCMPASWAPSTEGRMRPWTSGGLHVVQRGRHLLDGLV